MLLQVKAARNNATSRGFVVIDPSAEIHSCGDGNSLWDTLDLLEGRYGSGSGENQHTEYFPGATLLQVDGDENSLTVTDGAGNNFICSTSADLWEAVTSLTKEVRGGELVVRQHAAPAQNRRCGEQTIFATEECSEDDSYSPVRDMLNVFVGGDSAAIGESIIRKLRSVGHRGAAPKPGSRKIRKVRRGDIY